MSLTDIMSAAGLSSYAVVALLLFIVAFLIIVLRVFLPSKKRGWERAARMPLDDERPQPPRPGAGST
jgi:cbb3-type cytochrome oxidase subunit 3